MASAVGAGAPARMGPQQSAKGLPEPQGQDSEAGSDEVAVGLVGEREVVVRAAATAGEETAVVRGAEETAEAITEVTEVTEVVEAEETEEEAEEATETAEGLAGKGWARGGLIT